MCLAIERIKPLKPLAEKGIKALQNKFGSPDYNALNDEMKKTFVKVITEDLSPLLPRVKASTLLVFGENDTVSWLSTGDSESTSIESTVMAGLSATSRGWRFGAKYKAVATAPPRTTAETEPTIQYRNGLADPDTRLKFRHAEGL